MNFETLFYSYNGNYCVSCAVMTLSKWYEEMTENILHASDHDEEKRKTITASGDVRSSLDGSSVYRVRTVQFFE